MDDSNLEPASPTFTTEIHSVEHELYDANGHMDSRRNSSGADDEAVFDDYLGTRASSPETSHSDDDEISQLPEDCRFPSVSDPFQTPFTPHKGGRSPFRNPSSVKAIQLDTTPPHLTSASQHRYRLSTPSRNSTPRSTRSFQRSSRQSPSKMVKKEYALILLHVTVLPPHCPYSQEILESVLPAYVIENWKVLRDKVTQTVMDRGILIPHPKEDYDLMEERILEALELKVPRILQCGHFHLSEEEEEDILSSEDEFDTEIGGEICEDCGRRIRIGTDGSSISKRWDVKIFASNGLMRANAWGVAWRDMERIDVEIQPWIDDVMRRELELRKEEEDTTQSAERIPTTPSTMDERRRREIYGDDAQTFVDGFVGSPTHDTQYSHHSAPQHRRNQRQEVPLSDLLANYFQVLIQDRRNIAVVFLSALVLFLSVGGLRVLPPPLPVPKMQMHQQPPSQQIPTPSVEVKVEIPQVPILQVPIAETISSIAVSASPSVSTTSIASTALAENSVVSEDPDISIPSVSNEPVKPLESVQQIIEAVL